MQARIGIILGSGLGDFVSNLYKPKSIATSTIPSYPHSTVQGHSGAIVFGRLSDIPMVVFQGRIHYYETGNLETVLHPIRVAHALGIKTLIVTNAAGGVNPAYSPGDLMLLSDQINLTFNDPLASTARSHLIRKLYKKNRELYPANLRNRVSVIARKSNIRLQEGVYCGVQGPSYETASEIRMVAAIGGDAVGMSTVNEVSLAASFGMKVIGISCITNLATGIGTLPLSHSEVTETADRVKTVFSDLVKGIVKGIA